MEFLIILQAVLSLITSIGTFTVQGRKASVFFVFPFHLSAELQTPPPTGSIIV